MYWKDFLDGIVLKKWIIPNTDKNEKVLHNWSSKLSNSVVLWVWAKVAQAIAWAEGFSAWFGLWPFSFSSKLKIDQKQAQI